MKKGYYDLLLNLTDEISDSYLTKDIKNEAKTINNIDSYLTNQLSSIIVNHLSNIDSVSDKIKFLNNLLANFSSQQFSHDVLLQIKDSKQDINYQSNIRLVDNYLFTNSKEQNLIEQLNKEIITSDAVAFVYPFISKAMINKLRNAFSHALQHNIPITLITTTFDDQALFVNLYELEQLIKTYPNITIRIEDNTELRSERIHIKAAIFQRDSGFSSAVIGSSNLTMPGMATGREWNLRISQFDNQELYQKVEQEYQKLWEDNLLDFNDELVRKELFKRIDQKQQDKHIQLVNYVLYDFQIEILEKLAYRRKINKHKHLIIMATGTGKTVVSAFDYLKQVQNHGRRPKILFLAHQKEIVEQALATFRQVLNDANFASILNVGKHNFSSGYLFATIQTVHLHLKRFSVNQFDVIVFDEAHHIAAKTFDRVFNYFQPEEVIGLTATPEREDNKSILPYFDDEFAYELRLWDAIDQRLLSKFDYYCIDDIQSNLVGVDLNNDQQVFRALNNHGRNELLFSVIKNYIGIYHQPLALVFCINVEHAEVISNFLNQNGLKAAYLTSKTNHLRSKIISDFKKRKINYLCVVNMFNEGMDVPEIDSIILLRPTNSKTIFLQQLGRGLRKTNSKNKLSVYDLIANIDQKYDITVGIKNLYHNQATLKHKDIFEQGFSLPEGCTINLEARSKEVILNNLQAWYQVPKRMYQVVRDYYQKYQMQGLARIIADYDLSLPLFYQYLDNFYLKVALSFNADTALKNQSGRNKNILKQFLFLNNYHIVSYFYHRLANDLSKFELNYYYDNLLVVSLFPEVTSMKVFDANFASSSEDLVQDFISNHELIVKELIMILEYKLNHETLLVSQSEVEHHPLLIKDTTYTVRQALVAINRLNFLKQLGPLKVIAFQAGYLTYDQTKSVVLADVDASNYGKLTRYDADRQEFYWSVPENKSISSKLVRDLQTQDITKFLFLDNKINKNYPNLSLKLYNFVGVGSYLATLNDKYLTIKFKIEEKK
ncbi:DEAD/DEAH box helicase family protein [Spiroplasma platyhelix]|uniref:DEAD/DEAH box helicase family protein n=1 Tax=Spiroplasma platyhelix PALS-1 TaxID=1276218 RepID=A0A846U5Q9_9MOLU|nr:DEAD/DEAH box helicase family protein [Spiroplasma platyhelix]MBE4704415.1 UvrABC system protein B [Spiroplasma platyhelix PALS-1]NKE38787.1 DEAD/DEAH box helicase family protein [Spiroplasma platyhelix PALS-1]UJB28998.1 helicase [Spiroplasma platyhelix PALS-1]